MRFDGQTVFVTGAAGGIGAVLCERFAAEGASVVAADLVPATGAGVSRAVTLDVTDRDQVRAAVADAGPVDVLVNNAAKAGDVDLLDLPESQWDTELAVGLKGPYLCTQAVLPAMVSRGSGVILNVASVNAVTYLGNDAYSAAKAGLLSLTRGVAVKYGPAGVRCNAVLPGTVRTPVWEKRLAADPEVLDRAARWYPLGRVGAPADIAAAALFLCSADASWITGATLPVDGGLLAGNQPMVDDIVIDTDHGNEDRLR